MPVIDLRGIEIAVINMPHQERRRNRVAEQLSRAGLAFTFIDGVKDSPRFQGCSRGHLAAVEHCMGKEPFLILEDDVALTEWFTPGVEVPEGAGLFYLGHSPYGHFPGLPQNWFGSDIVERTPEGLRVHSMLAAHAILYLTPEASGQVRGAIRDSLDKVRRHDIGLTELQRCLNVFTAEKPMFCQNAEVQGRNKRGLRDRMFSYVCTPREEGSAATTEDGAGRFTLIRAGDGALTYAPAVDG